MQHGHRSRPTIKKLRSNLMRQQKDRDPLFYYEVVNVLGLGSMGSVAKVRKRTEVLGGSARKSLRESFDSERRIKTCLQIPILGGLFRHCIDSDQVLERKLQARKRTMKRAMENGNSVALDGELSHNGSHNQQPSFLSLSSSSPMDDSFYSHDDSLREGHPHADRNGKNTNGNSNGLDRSGSMNLSIRTTSSSYEAYYAMKSIHLDRVTDPTFVQELRNEIAILKKLVRIMQGSQQVLQSDCRSRIIRSFVRLSLSLSLSRSLSLSLACHCLPSCPILFDTNRCTHTHIYIYIRTHTGPSTYCATD